MRAMLLSAGRGERMRPLTDLKPKPLLSVLNTPLIIHHIKNLEKAGIHEIVINLGYLGYQIEQLLRNGQQWNVDIQYSYEDPILGTGGGIVNALPLLGNEPFIVLSSDIFTHFPLDTLPKEPKGVAHIVLVDNPFHHPKGDYCLKDNIVFDIGEPKLNFAGMGVYRASLFEGLKPEKFSLPTLFPKAFREKKITGEHFKGLWHNVGTVSQLKMLNEDIMKVSS